MMIPYGKRKGDGHRRCALAEEAKEGI